MLPPARDWAPRSPLPSDPVRPHRYARSRSGLDPRRGFCVSASRAATRRATHRESRVFGGCRSIAPWCAHRSWAAMRNRAQPLPRARASGPAAPTRRRGWRPPCRRPRWRCRPPASSSEPSCGLHQRLDLFRGFLQSPREDLGGVGGDQHLIFDANADVPELLRYPRRRPNVNPRLDGQHHSRLQYPPLAPDLVIADVMHVEAEPMSRAMTEKLHVLLVLDECRDLALEQPQLDETLGNHAHGGFVRMIPVVPGTHLVDGGELSLQHDVVDRALGGREPAADRKGARDVRGVEVVLAARVEQQQITIAQQLIVVSVMHDAG